MRKRGKIERHEVNGFTPAQAHEVNCTCGVEHFQKADLRAKAKGEDPPPSLGKIGRNEPCPCGSGKKFKKCCEVAP